MKSTTDDALSKLRSVHFFDVLRGTLRDLGLAGQEKFGIALFVVALSRYLASPLRLHIQQSTEGGAALLARSVAELLPKNQRVAIYRDLPATLDSGSPEASSRCSPGKSENASKSHTRPTYMTEGRSTNGGDVSEKRRRKEEKTRRTRTWL
jgi:hypothetical protein